MTNLAGSNRLSNGGEDGKETALDISQLRSELERALATQIDRKEAVLHVERDGLVVTLREFGFFDSGSADMKPSAKAAFDRVAAILRAHSCAVRVEGHTDNVPIHTAEFASNWELSTARASRLVRSLIETHGISPALLSAAGYAEFRPASDNSTIQGRASNRRVDLVILNVRSNTTRDLDPSLSRAPGSDVSEARRMGLTQKPERIQSQP